MFFYFTFRIISSAVAFLYPGYACYKTLSQRPANEQDIERWLMYWSVMGCVVAVETIEWAISWLPLYYALKTAFLLYLALPQTRGSSYIYTHHLQPFFNAYEPQIDATLSSLKIRIYAYIQQYIRALWGNLASSMGQSQPQSNILNEDAAANRGAPPSMSDPVSGPAQLLSSFWSSFGPGIVAAGTTIMRQAQAAAVAAGSNPSQTLDDAPVPSSNQAILERRKQLEAELAALSNPAVQPYDMDSPSNPPLPIPPASTAVSRTPSDEDGKSGLRERTTSSGKFGKFEEVEVPSDAEGDTSYGRPVSAARTSWFGWGGNSGYERVKKD